ncbi:MAG: helix-turn-helix domain-containing protein [Candidatus Limnocylindrales bacterium]
MDDTRLGSIYRALRRRRGWRQVDLAVAAGCSRGTISRIERGHLDDVVLGMLRRVSDALETRLDLVPRWQGGELDRLVARGHAELHEAFATFLAARPGWTMRPEGRSPCTANAGSSTFSPGTGRAARCSSSSSRPSSWTSWT